MPRAPVVPPGLRIGYLRHDLLEGLRARRPRQLVRAFATFAAPHRWPPSGRTRSAVLDARYASGGRLGAATSLAELESHPDSHRPGSVAALRRASALEVVAEGMPPAQRRAERLLAAYLRGELGPPPAALEGPPADRALAAATALREQGFPTPVIVATFPGFHPNPYGSLMELAYPSHGLGAIHVTDPAGIDAILAAQREGGYRTVMHLNAPDRFVGRVRSGLEAAATASRTLAMLDDGIARGAVVVTSVHNGPRLVGLRAAAEQEIAQGIVDRASVVHLLSTSTPGLLAGWVHFDPARCVHVPHPNYDGVYDPIPARELARARIGLPSDDPDSVVVGLIGSLADRKGGVALLEAFARTAGRLPDGRPLRLLIAGTLIGGRAEDLLRQALADPRVIARFGYLPDDEIPWLLGAIDVAVIPYGQLNSGWLHLALSAGIPAIAPEGGTATEVALPEALRLFAAGDPSSLSAALLAAGDLTSPEARAAARRSVAGLEARSLSERFVAAVVAASHDAGGLKVGATR